MDPKDIDYIAGLGVRNDSRDWMGTALSLDFFQPRQPRLQERDLFKRGLALNLNSRCLLHMQNSFSFCKAWQALLKCRCSKLTAPFHSKLSDIVYKQCCRWLSTLVFWRTQPLCMLTLGSTQCAMWWPRLDRSNLLRNGLHMLLHQCLLLAVSTSQWSICKSSSTNLLQFIFSRKYYNLSNKPADPNQCRNGCLHNNKCEQLHRSTRLHNDGYDGDGSFPHPISLPGRWLEHLWRLDACRQCLLSAVLLQPEWIVVVRLDVHGRVCHASVCGLHVWDHVGGDFSRE